MNRVTVLPVICEVVPAIYGTSFYSFVFFVCWLTAYLFLFLQQFDDDLVRCEVHHLCVFYGLS